MINILIGIFYIALVALTSYLLYYIIKIAIKDAYYEIEFKEDSILRLISSNDIRARILPIPVEIFEKIKACKDYNVVINKEERKLNINTERRYFGGVTEIYKNADYIDYKGKEKKKSYWKMNEDKRKIFIEFE